MKAKAQMQDTAKKALIASAVGVKKFRAKVVVKRANMFFPEIIAEHKSNSISYIKDYAERYRGLLISLYDKSRKYNARITSILKSAGVPQEFAALVAIESQYTSKAVSPAGAVGWWQFMDETAKGYGLKIASNPVTVPDLKSMLQATDPKKIAIEKVTDDRWSLDKSTRAAARYLKDSYRTFGDWLLVAASYNCGSGRVRRAMAACGKSNPDFWDIKALLPAETRAYVMKFIAYNVVFKNFNNFVSGNMIFNDVSEEREFEIPAMNGVLL